MAPRKKTTIGWEEWCALPALSLPAIKAKIDTGAKTSALHAYDIEFFKEGDQKMVRFKIHPLVGNKKLVRTCCAPLVEHRSVTSSNGEREKRPTILTPISINNQTVNIKITLTSRHKMKFRMLLGREALRKIKAIVDPGKSYMLGKIQTPLTLYESQKE